MYKTVTKTAAPRASYRPEKKFAFLKKSNSNIYDKKGG
jgi:hypothetical protein